MKLNLETFLESERLRKGIPSKSILTTLINGGCIEETYVGEDTSDSLYMLYETSKPQEDERNKDGHVSVEHGKIIRSEEVAILTKKGLIKQVETGEDYRKAEHAGYAGSRSTRRYHISNKAKTSYQQK